MAGWANRVLEWPWQPFVAAFRRHGHYRVSFFFLVAFAVFAVLLWRRGLRPESVYVLATVLFVLETGAIASAPRYIAVLFPAFFVIGEWMERSFAIRYGYGVAGAVTLGVEIWRFASGRWVS